MAKEKAFMITREKAHRVIAAGEAKKTSTCRQPPRPQ
jgi:hypothetical protein